MSPAYRLITLAQAQAGMVLAQALLDRQGQVLLTKGAVLTETALASLARHGVEMVPVNGPAPAPPAAPADVQARLDHLFRHNERDNHDDWATGVLRRYIEDFRFDREATS